VMLFCHIIFFFQAEDGIRDSSVTGVQTCALPIFKVKEVEELIYGKKMIMQSGII